MSKDSEYFTKGTNNLEHVKIIEDFNKMRYVGFLLGEQEFGVHIEEIIEVLPIPEITSVAHTPEFIKGVMNLRGQIICVVDLRSFFSIDILTPGENSRVVVVQTEDKNFGIIVDAISKIHICENVHLDSIPATITGKIAELLSGVALVGEDTLMVINLKNLINSEDFKQFE